MVKGRQVQVVIKFTGTEDGRDAVYKRVFPSGVKRVTTACLGVGNPDWNKVCNERGIERYSFLKLLSIFGQWRGSMSGLSGKLNEMFTSR
jgi:hypothetical protein